MTPDWQEIITRHRHLVVHTVRRIVGNDADAEDVAQEVFLELYSSCQQQAVQSWTGFLRRVATCRALDFIRSRRIRSQLDTGVLLDNFPGPSEVAAGRELAERLRQALGLLSPQEAQVFCLRYFEDLPYEEISQTLSITTNAVGIALHKARKRLETILHDKSR